MQNYFSVSELEQNSPSPDFRLKLKQALFKADLRFGFKEGSNGKVMASNGTLDILALYPRSKKNALKQGCKRFVLRLVSMLDQIARSWPAKESYFRALDVSVFLEEAGEMHQKKHRICNFLRSHVSILGKWCH